MIGEPRTVPYIGPTAAAVGKVLLVHRDGRLRGGLTGIHSPISAEDLTRLSGLKLQVSHSGLRIQSNKSNGTFGYLAIVLVIISLIAPIDL